jgi:hypothetical protein
VTLPSKEELLERERRWLKPAGLMAVIAALLFAGSVALTHAGLPFPDTQAEQLDIYHDHSSRLILAGVIGGIGFVLFTPALFLLFQAASGRAEKMRRSLLPLVVLGPLLVGVQGVLLAVGLSDATDKFVEQAPAVEAKARQQAESAAATKPSAAKPESGKAAETGTTTSASTTTASTTAAQQPKSPDEAADDARDDLATDLTNDSGAVKASRIIGFLGGIALLVGIIYTSIWSMRTGLLTRFWATVGIAFTVVLVLIPPIGPVGLVLWFAAIGLMFMGRWVSRLPPAWAAGVAIPWPSAGGGPPMPASTVEGSGREVSEPPLPEDSATNGSGEAEDYPGPTLGGTQGERRKKRKRRG